MVLKKSRKVKVIVSIVSFSIILFISITTCLKYKNSSENKLIKAVIENDFNELKSLVEDGAYVNSSDDALATPFMWAAFKGNLEMMEFLKKKGASFNQTGVISLDNFQRIYISSINAAAGEGHLYAVKYLVEDCGVEINKNQRSYNIFYYRNEDLLDAESLYEVIKSTDKKKLRGISLRNYKKSDNHLKEHLVVDINHAITYYNLNIGYGTPITAVNKFPQALMNRRIVDEMFGEILLVKKAVNYEVFSNSEIGATPIVEAAVSGHLEIVRYLIKKGADINKSVNGESALNNSLFMGHFEIAKLLIEMGAKTDVLLSETKSGVLNILAMKDISKIEGKKDLLFEIAQELIRKGADVNNKDSYGFTPLYLSCSLKNREIAQLFVNNGANLDFEVYGEKIRDICKRNDIEFKM